MQRRLIVIGGGIAGLAAARALRRRLPDAAITLLEAAPRLGGRIHTIHDAVTGEPVELGAEFVHGKPPALLAALAEAGLTLDGEEEESDADSPFALFPRLLAPLLRRGGPDVTVAAFLKAQALAPHQREMLLGFVRGFYVAPPERASALAIARMEVAAQALGGDQGRQVREGYGKLVAYLARALPPAALRLGTVATRLEWKPGQVTVHARSAAGVALAPLTAEAAIVAVPFPVLAGGKHGLRFTPALPGHRKAAAALQMGAATKVLLRFAHDSTGPLPVAPFFMGSPPLGVFWSGVGTQAQWLIGWAGGPNADRLDRLTDAAVLRLALKTVAAHTKKPVAQVARALTDFRCVRWSRAPFIDGAYAFVPLGADFAMDALSLSVERTLFFAGEHTDAKHAGTVSGAFDSGVRAATELCAG